MINNKMNTQLKATLSNLKWLLKYETGEKLLCFYFLLHWDFDQYTQST